MDRLILSWLILTLVLSGHAFPDQNSRAEKSSNYTLEALVSLALEHNTAILEGRWRVRGATARLRKSKAAGIFPKLRLETSSGLVPDAKGDVFHPPSDTSGMRSLGAFNRTQLEFVQPLYTFGYLDRLKEAARAGVEVEKAALSDVEVDIALQVKELYYGLLIAQDLYELSKRLSEELLTHHAQISLDDPSVPLSAPYKLDLALIELERRQREAADHATLARRALVWTVGLARGNILELETEWLEPIKVQVPPKDSLHVLALRQRPDWRKLRAGIAAKQALRDAATKAYLPQVFLGGGVRYAVAPHRTDQHNPFVKDEFNYLNGGVFLGLRQSFEWGLLGADVDRAQAELFELRAKKEGAAQAIGLEIDSAYGEYERTEANLQSARETRRVTREWLRAAKDEFELDPQQIKELVSAFEAFAQSEQAYLEAIYDFNLTVARLQRVVGITSAF